MGRGLPGHQSGQHGSANDTMAVAVYAPLLRPESFRPLSYYLAHMTRGPVVPVTRRSWWWCYTEWILMMTYRAPSALCKPVLGPFKGALDGTFHELFGATSTPFIPSAPSTIQFSYLLSDLGALSDLDVLSGIGTLSSPAPSVALAPSAARDAHDLIGSVPSLASWAVSRPCIVRGSTSIRVDGTKRLGRPARCSTHDTFHDIFGTLSVPSAPSKVQFSYGVLSSPSAPSSHGVVFRPSNTWRPERPRRPVMCPVWLLPR